MKKRIALLLAVMMGTVMALGMGTASALTPTYTSNTIDFQYKDYYTGETVSDSILPGDLTITSGSVDLSGFSSPRYYIHSVSPTYLTFNPAVATQIVTVRVSLKNSTTYPTPTYYNGQVLSLGNGDYVYASIEGANPLAPIPAGTTLALTTQHLGGLSPSNSRLSFSTTNPAIATTMGPIILGNTPGNATLNVYYNGSLIITKSIVVTSSSYYNGGSIVTADDNLRIGPVSFNARKGRSYKFINIRLEGIKISPTKLRWESSDTRIATVSKSGVVRTRKAGTVVITAETRDGENSASIDFIVS